jgi:hypothetical protein
MTSQVRRERDLPDRVLLFQCHTVCNLAWNQVEQLAVQRRTIGTASDRTAVEALVYLHAVHQFAQQSSDV